MKEQLISAIKDWKQEMTMAAKIKFVQRGTNLPLTGQQYTVRLYDKDLFSDDDYLGHEQLNADGEALISFHPADIRNHGLGIEQLPDLYILLFKGNVVHFQTKVWDNINFSKLADFNIYEGCVVDFGTFLVD